MITNEDIAERIIRLGDLARRFGDEVCNVSQPVEALTEQERQGYLAAVTDAIAGLDAARAALARAQERIARGIYNNQWTP